MQDYPHLAFHKRWEISPEIAFMLGQCQAMVSSICEIPLNPNDYNNLLRIQLIRGAQATTAIEGNTLSEEEVADVEAGKELPPSKRYQEIEVKNILAAMNQILREVTQQNKTAKITPELLLRFHEIIGQDLGEHFDADPGKLRTDARTVGRYKCPPHDQVKEHIQRMSLIHI